MNIGDRQKGRLRSESIISCGDKAEDIAAAISGAMNEQHKTICKNVISPYGNGHAAERIAEKVFEVVQNDTIDLKKKFYDLGEETS